MKKIITILFTCLTFAPFMTHAADTYEECAAQIFRETSFNPPQEYNDILNGLIEEAKGKAATWAKTPINAQLSCVLNNVTVYDAACVNKTPIECGVPESCWCVLAKVLCDKILNESPAREKYKQQKCGHLPKKEKDATNKSTKPDDINEDKTTDTSNQSKQEKAKKRADKQAAKEAECAAKNPPQVAKKNFLGKWICADSDATTAERDQKKAANKNLKAFWDDMDDLDKAFQKKIKQLQKNGGTK